MSPEKCLCDSGQDAVLSTSPNMAHHINAVLDAVAAEVVVVDRKGQILAVNAPWQRFSLENSRTPGEPAANTLIGANYLSVCRATPGSADFADAVMAAEGIEAVLNGDIPEFSMDYPCDSPTEKRWFTMLVRPLGDAARDGLVITHFDVTRLKLAEASAQKRLDQRRQAEVESNKLFQAIEQSPIAMLITDPEGVIEYVNPRFLETTGYSSEDLLGQSLEILNSGEARHASYASLWQAIFAGQAWQGVLCNRIRNAELISTNTSLAPIHNKSGQITHFAVVMEDVTERLQVERELAEYHLRLEELVEQRTAELSQALETARLADLTKNAFLANITHELRTPLSAVIGFADLARPLSQHVLQRQYLDNVISAGKNLGATIDDLLDLSKIVAGCLKFEAKPFSIRSLVARSSSFISYKAADKGLRLVHLVDDEVPPVLIGDPLRIEQILLNLLSNAVKFTDQGSIKLEISLLATETERVCLQLSVEDTGIGIREEEIELLFKPFSQADGSITRRFGGTGLGLAICDHLAKMMDGQIRVRSEVGAGTRFLVELWLNASDAQTVIDEELGTPDYLTVRYRETRALIVDDQIFNRDLVAILLTAVGITPYFACNGQEALDLLIADPQNFDIVLMDIQMPVMDGRTATRELRNMLRFAQLPIIAMTAHTMTHEREHSALAGMNDHVGKPFNKNLFYRVLATWISPEKQFRDMPTAIFVPAPAAPAAEVPKIAGIDSIESISLMQDDVGRYLHWLREFLDSGPETLQQLRSAIASADREQASMAVHRLKGRTGFLGMYDAHAIATSLETAIDGGVPCDALVIELKRSVDELCVAIESELGRTGKGMTADA